MSEMAEKSETTAPSTPPHDRALQDDQERADMIARNRAAAAEARKKDPSLLRRLRDKMKRLKDEDPNTYPLI